MPLNSERRKSLSNNIPEGFIVTRQWLMMNNFGRHAIDNLVKSGQLKIISNGVYSRGDVLNSWEVVVYALQKFKNLDCVVGGLTSLELHGLAHYIPLSRNQIVRLYCPQPFPKWINEFSKDLTFTRHSSTEIFSGGEKKNIELFTTNTKWRMSSHGLITSTPERAMLEVLLDVPDEISFDHANELMQGMTTFVPQVVQSMLEQCSNVKCKRLFLLLAERNHHQWVSKINVSKIDLGVGKRMLVKGGMLDKKYRITVPKSHENNRDFF